MIFGLFETSISRFLCKSRLSSFCNYSAPRQSQIPWKYQMFSKRLLNISKPFIMSKLSNALRLLSALRPLSISSPLNGIKPISTMRPSNTLRPVNYIKTVKYLKTLICWKLTCWFFWEMSYFEYLLFIHISCDVDAVFK